MIAALVRRLSAAVLALAPLAASAQAPEPTASGVVQLDYLRYEGRYYEIARLPNFRQRNCASDVVTTFLRRTDGDISIVYQCVESNRTWIMDIGRLAISAEARPGELNFRPDQIGWSPWYWGTYRLIELAGDFSYAMIGDAGGSRLWILSRTRQMSPDVYDRLVARAAERGYDTSRLVRSAQPGI